MVKIETEIVNQTALVVVNGDIDASSSIQLDESLNSQLKTASHSVVIDCTNLNYISSAGLGVFMSYIEEFKATNQKFILFGLSEKVQNVFEMLGLDQLMNIVTSKQDAFLLLDEA